MHMNRIRIAAPLLVALLSISVSAQTGAPQPRRKVTLREALQLAAKQGPDVAAARAQAAIAEAQVRRAWTAWQPDLSATGTFDHTNAISKVDFSAFAPVLQAFGAPVPPPTTIVDQNNY